MLRNLNRDFGGTHGGPHASNPPLLGPLTAEHRRVVCGPSQPNGVRRQARVAARSSEPGGFTGSTQCTAPSAVSPGRPRPRHFPHRLRPGVWRPALRWRCNPAIRPPGGPSGDPAVRNVRHSQSGPARVMVRTAPAPARSGGRGRWRRRVPNPAMSSRGRGTAPGPATAAGDDGGSPPGPGPAPGGAAPPGRSAAGTGGGGDGVVRRRSRRAAGLRPLAASESAVAPPGLSPMDTQHGAPSSAS